MNFINTVKNNNPIENKLFEILIERKGGQTTIKILDTLWKRPMNKNQLANIVGVDYNTVKHHTNLLIKEGFIKTNSKKYGATLNIAPVLLNNIETYKEVKKLIIINNK